MRHPVARWARLVGVVLAVFLCLAPLDTMAAVPSAADASVPVLRVLTFGPGDQTFAKFGHDAIWVHDPRQPPERRDLVFNYGTFRFDSPWLIMDFLKGKLSYWLSASSLRGTLAAYRAANRSVRAQLLDVTPEQARSITAFLHENVKPENAYYRYDYYRDNCATRIRDLLDRQLGNALAKASRGPAALTYREHTRRLTVDSPLLFFGLDLAMGPLIDRPVTEWEEMFLPGRVEAKLAQATTERGTPLVKETRTLFEANRAPLPETPPGFRWGWLGLGLTLGAGCYALGRSNHRGARVALAAAVGATGALTGILGVLLSILWFFTDHDVTYYNQNLLSCPLWALALPFLAVDLARERPRRSGALFRLVAASVLTATLALLLRLLVPGNQDTTTALSLFVPLWLGVGGAVWERCGRRVPPLVGARPEAAKEREPPLPVAES